MVPPTFGRIDVAGESVSTDGESDVIGEEQPASVARTMAVAHDLRST